MNVKNYVKDEVIAVQSFLDKIGLTDYKLTKGNEDDLTGTDVIITVHDKTLKAKVKIEDNWPYVTGNITLDAISAFSWIGRPAVVNRICRLLPLITVHQLGSFYQSTDDIMIKMIRDKKTNRQDFFAYDIKKMKELSFINYVEKNCDIKINPKKTYDLDDSWDSAFFCIAIADPKLKQTELTDLSSLMRKFQEGR